MKANIFLLIGAALTWGWLTQAQSIQFASDASGNLTQRTVATSAAPQILRQPQIQVVVPGEYATFSVLLADPAGCSYQWRFNGTNLTGQTSDSLLLTKVGTNQQGPYTVVVTNNSGSVTSDVAQLYIDRRGSGMPDAWQLAYFGNLNQNADADFDGDGVSNLREFLEGTNPTNRTSFRTRLTVIADTGGAVSVAPAQTSYAQTDTVTLTGTAFPPNAFASWTGDLTNRSNPTTLAMNTNKTVRAHFACDPPPYGMVGWWRGENDASDALGLNSGALSNSVSFVAGQVGQAFLFNGTTTNQQLRVPASSSLDLGPGPGLTLEAWIKPANLTTQMPLLEWNDGTNWGAHFWANVGFSGQGGPGCIYANIRDINRGDHYFFSPAGLLNTNAWSHVAVTYDHTTGIAVLYFNGFAVSTVNLGLFTPWTSPNFYLGYRPGAVSYAGLMDEVSVFNRPLSGSEVYAIYLADAAGKCPNAPYITSPTRFPDGLTGIGYTQQIARALGTAPVTFSLSAGSLPDGLTLSPSGLLSGIPTSVGSNVFAVLVTDASGFSSEQICGLRVFPGPVPAMVGGLVSWWRAENNGLDSVSTNHGFLSNGVSFASGEVGQSFVFNGTNSFVQVGTNAGLIFSNTCTLEAWIYPTGTGADPFNGGVILNKEGQYEVARFGDGSIRWAFANASPGWNWVSSGGYAPLNQWTHVVVTYDSGVVNTYLNGALVQSFSGSGPIGFAQLTQNDFRIGTRQAVNQFFQGKIDEACVYNRAISAGEVTALYNSTTLGKPALGPYINTSPLPNGILGQPYSQTFTSVRGTAPITYSLAGGGLPPGLALAPSGTLTGTPTNAGVFTFNLLATDAAALGNAKFFSIRVDAPIPPPAGIVGWWRAEGNGLDSIGTNNGVFPNGVAYAPGQSGQAFSFNGLNQSLEISNAPALRPASVTLEAWVMYNNNSGLQQIIAKPLGSGFLDSYALWTSSGTINGAISDTNGFVNILTVPFSPVLKQWYHLVFTFDDLLKQEALYLNGTLIATNYLNKSINYDNQPILLGRDIENGNPAYFLNGRMDEAAIYNRALSASEVAALYGAGTAGKTVVGPYFTSSPTLPDAVKDEVYNAAVTTTRGSGQITYSLSSGALPAGLSLNSSGLLTGPPTVSGTFTFTIRATDGASLSAEQTCTLRVNSRPAPAPGILSWWRGENNGQDAMGNNNAVLINNTTFAPGKVGQAFAFSPASDGLKIPDSPSLRPASLTLEAWVLFQGLNGPSVIFAKPLGGGSLDSFIFFYNNGILDGVIADNSGFGPDITAPFTPVLGQWYHVAYTFDDTSKQQTLYLNGTPINSSIANKSIAYDTQPLGIGRDVENGAAAFFFNGRIDEPAIYGRALLASEIAAIYNAGASGKAVTGPYFTTAPNLPPAAVGQAYAFSLSSTRAALPVSYSVTGGALPLGMNLSAGGNLTGPATAGGAYSFTVRVTDATALFAEQTFTISVVGQQVPPGGLVSWWRGEGNALDSAGSNHGILRNGVTFGAGESGQAFVLDGIDNSVEIPDAPSLRPASITLETWVMFNAGGTRIVMGKPVGTGVSDSYQIYFANNTINAFVGDLFGPGAVLSAPLTPVFGQWYHVAYTFDDATRQQVLYLNGLVVAIGTGNKLIGYDSNPVLLGRDTENGNAALFLNGRIDEASIFNRALTGAEVYGLYRAGSAGKTTVGPYFTTAPFLPEAVLSQGYTQTITTTRGTLPVGYTLTGGTLPPGLSLSSAGVLAGVPASSGTYTFSIRGTDAASLSCDQFFTLQVYAPVLVPSGMIGWWRGESNALDVIGTHNGTLQGGAAYGAGRVGTAFKLDGINSYIDLGPWNAGSNWTLEAWVSPAAAPGGRTTIFGSLATCTDWGLELSGGQFTAQVRPPGGCTTSLGSGTYPFLNRWYHLAATSDGTNAMVYVNGVFSGSTVVDTNYLGNASGLRIGSSVCCGEYFSGLVDEVAIYNRALTSNEIASIYGAGPAGKTQSLPIKLKVIQQNPGLVLSFGSIPGRTYTLEYRDSLSTGSWQPLATLPANGTTTAYTNSITSPQQRFFRIQTGPN